MVLKCWMCETSRCIIRLRGEKAILLHIQANIVGHQRYLHTPRITLGGKKIACTHRTRRKSFNSDCKIQVPSLWSSIACLGGLNSKKDLTQRFDSQRWESGVVCSCNLAPFPLQRLCCCNSLNHFDSFHNSNHNFTVMVILVCAKGFKGG